MIDSQGREWHVYEREDGSITVYYTRGQEAVHHVVWDSLDRQPTQLALDGAIAPDNQQVLPADVLVGEGTLPDPPVTQTVGRLSLNKKGSYEATKNLLH